MLCVDGTKVAQSNGLNMGLLSEHVRYCIFLLLMLKKHSCQHIENLHIKTETVIILNYSGNVGHDFLWG